MARMGDKEFERLAVLHAMGALSPDEVARFEAERAARGQGAERIVQGVERTLARPTGRAGALSVERADLAAVTARYPAGRRRPWIALSLLLAIGLAGALAWGFWLNDRVGTLEGERDATAVRADSLAAAVAAGESLRAHQPRSEELTPLLSAADLVAAPLAGGTGAGGRILAGAAGAILVAQGLPALDGGVYRLWRVGPAGPEPLATLGSAPYGFLFALFPDAAFLESGGRLVLTAEGDTEAAAPAGPTLLEGRLPAR